MPGRSRTGQAIQVWLARFACFFLVSSLYMMYNMSQMQNEENTGNSNLSHSDPDTHIRDITKTEDDMKDKPRAHADNDKTNALFRVNEPSIAELLESPALKSLQKVMFQEQNRPRDSVYQLNVTLSDKISLNRPVADTRPVQCLSFQYDIDSLPTASVIVPFYNEALSMLLRTVHSVLRRSPDKLLVEVIMVDDASPNENLKDRLSTYVKYLPKVRLIRNKVRQGLIRSRVRAAEMARGEVLIFLDAHTEANEQWLEPILHEIWKDPRKVLQPTVDKIDPRTIQYLSTSGMVPRAAFSWDLRYVWMQMPVHEVIRLVGSKSEPFRSPTLVGCAIAVSKSYFKNIGSFDEGLNIWGGENIELAFRVWLCGGEVLTLPCSRVAHTFKPFSYKFDGNKDAIVTKNLMRVAEMWMGDYKRYFYASVRVYPFKNVEFTTDEKRSLERRKKLRQKLKCRPFKWYMDNIVPEIYAPPADAYLFGEVRNAGSNACFYVLPDGVISLTYFCYYHRILPDNMFHITSDSRLMYKDKCVRAIYPSFLLQVGPCDRSVQQYKWGITGVQASGLLKTQISAGKERGTYCVMQVTERHGKYKGKQMVRLVRCDPHKRFQSWDFTYRLEYKYVPKEVDNSRDLL